MSYRAFSGYIRVQFGRPFGYISDGFLSDYIGFIRMDSGGNLSERTAPGWLMNGANRHLTEPNSGPLGGPEFGGLGAQKSTGQAGINPALARARGNNFVLQGQTLFCTVQLCFAARAGEEPRFAKIRTSPGWLGNGANRHLTEPNSGPLRGPEFGGLEAQKSTGQAGIKPALARA